MRFDSTHVSRLAASLLALFTLAATACGPRTDDDDDDPPTVRTDAGSGGSLFGSSGGSSGSSSGSSDDAGGYSNDTGGSNSYGTRSCEYIYKCAQSCPQEADNCVSRCYDQGSRQAHERLKKFDACNARNDCYTATSPEKCACRHCATEFRGCLPGACRGGNSSSCAVNSSMNCSQLLDCMSCCDSTADPGTCYEQTCGANTTQSAINKQNALFECSKRNGCNQASDPGACLQKYCATEVNACAND